MLVSVSCRVEGHFGERADDGISCGGLLTLAFGKRPTVLFGHEQAEPCERHGRRLQHEQEERHQPS
jgi:hypothetical protein